MMIKRITEQKELKQAFAIRKNVFITEQGVAESDEFDQYDKLENGAEHILLIHENAPVGTGRIRFTDGYGKLERICISNPYRNHGFGKELIYGLETIAKEYGKSKVKLHGQTQASGFYQKLGYQIYSEPFEEDGIDHVLMEKKL